MDKILNIFDKLIGKYSCWLFIALTFIYAILRTPFYDEAYAFMISQLSIPDIFKLIPIEGHPFIWYILLKIFCSSVKLYPYPMLILNWAFFSLFIYILWEKAPFNNLIKFLITFSYPFLNYYAIFARPYGLSILVLGLLTYLYKNSTKHPYIYSSLILICINVSVMSMIGAGAFLVLFVYKLIKEKIPKKALILIFSILIFGTVLSSLQFLGMKQIYKLIYLFDIVSLLPSFEDNPAKFIFLSIRLVLLFYIPYLLFKKSKESLFFIFFTYLIMVFINIKIYSFCFWHTYFYFIYFILALWIGWERIKKDKFLNIIFTILLINLLFPTSVFSKEMMKVVDTSHCKSYIEKVIILNQNKVKFYSPDWYSPVSSGIIPYLKKYNIDLYDIHNRKKDTYESMKNTYKYKLETFNGEEFIKDFDDSVDNYLLTAYYFFLHGNNENLFRFDKQDFYYKDLIKFKGIYCDFDYKYAIYKIEKLK